MRRRLLLLPATLLGAVALVFAFLHLVPGDPVEVMLGEFAMPADVESMRRGLGLDRPLPEQFVRFLGGLARGDLGDSIAFRAPVARVIAERYPATLELTAAALLLALLAGLPLGILAAIRHGSATDGITRGISLLGVCVPSVWLGPLLSLVFSIHFAWLPVSGRGSLPHLVLPATTLALGMAAILVRLTRASMLAVLREPHLRTATAKGASGCRTVTYHALPSALPPVVTVVGLQAGALLAGAIVTETVFAWPGIGRLLVQGIAARDYPLVQGCVLVVAVTYVLMNTIADLLVAWLDPRTREDG
jgi:peptide/nickel transport system permease protein